MTTIKGTTKLENRVAKWINARDVDYDGDMQSVIDDLMNGGCQSGIVADLIYYTDTVKFYNLYHNEIDAILKETLSDCGFRSPAELFGDKWNDDDPFARNDENRNLLAWFGFEETARKLASEAGIDV